MTDTASSHCHPRLCRALCLVLTVSTLAQFIKNHIVENTTKQRLVIYIEHHLRG